ncbi:MAG: ActD-like protein [Myxococcaceae bacterium]
MSKPKFEDWKLERYRLGEASADDARAIAAAALEDPALRARLEALEADDRATLERLPPAQVAQRVRDHATPAPARAWRWAPALALAAVALVGVVVLRARDTGDDVLRPKGDGPTLRLFRLAGQTPERLADGAHVRAHDVVQVAFELQGAPFAVVVSVDGGGHTTLHWPGDHRAESTAVAPGFKTLPQSFELDEAPGFERFFLVTSTRPLEPDAILEAAARAARDGALSVRPDDTWRALLLDKQPADGAPNP